MHIRSSAALLLVSLAASVLAQTTTFYGPLTTNNGVAACVQYGSCTTASGSQVTETQQAPVTPPASSQAIAAPTDSVQSELSISALAAQGAEAAYSSRVANGQGKSGSGNGATSANLTGTVIAGTTPTSVPAQSTGQADAAVAAPQLASLGGGARTLAWSLAIIAGAVGAGAVGL